MMKRTLVLGLFLAEFSASAPAFAQSLQVAHPASSFEAEVFFETGAVETVDALRDRRALAFDVRLGRLRFRCAHPLARRAAVRENLAGGRHSLSVIDVREYCHGQAYRAVAEGASIVLEYGNSRRPALRGMAAPRTVGRTLRSEPFVWSIPEEAVPHAPLIASIEPQRTQASPRFVTRLEGERRFTYLSPSDWSFVVRGSEGAVLCAPRAERHGPIAKELFRAPRAGRPLRGLVLQPDFACAEDVFAQPGIYEVLASAHSSVDARSVGLSGYVGRVYGPFSWVEVVDARPRRTNFSPRYVYDVTAVWAELRSRQQP